MSEHRQAASQCTRERESGAALLIAVLMLALVATIGFASLNTVARDREVAGNTGRAQSALYAADAGIAASLQSLRTEQTGSSIRSGECIDATVPSANLGNGASYGPDATATNQICMIAVGESCMENTDASLMFKYTVWDIRAQGNAAGGSVARVQATAGRCHAFNN
jgi:Tfp pilus assembly protein PilX